MIGPLSVMVGVLIIFVLVQQALSFFDRIYCHHIIDINRLQLAYIVIDLTKVKAPQPRKLVARQSTRG